MSNSAGVYDLPFSIGLTYGCTQLIIRSGMSLYQESLFLFIEHNNRQKMFMMDPDQAVQSMLKGICFDTIKVSADASKLIPVSLTDYLYHFCHRCLFMQLQ